MNNTDISAPTGQPALPALLPDSLIDEKQLSAHSGVARQTLQIWRMRRIGPPFIKVGRAVRYPWGEYQGWLTSRRQETRA